MMWIVGLAIFAWSITMYCVGYKVGERDGVYRASFREM